MSEAALRIDIVDRAIINRLQVGFPLTDRPYADVARELEITEDELLSHLQSLLSDKVLTRFGPMYNVEALGGEFVLAALHAPADRFDEIAEIVNDLKEVAHNYQREHELNMWFVVATDSRDAAWRVLEDIQARTGCQVYAMPKLDEYFVSLRFEV